jgi:hypothetical protein
MPSIHHLLFSSFSDYWGSEPSPRMTRSGTLLNSSSHSTLNADFSDENDMLTVSCRIVFVRFGCGLLCVRDPELVEP